MKFKGSYISYVLTYFFFYFSMAITNSVLSVYLTGIGKNASETSLIISAGGIFSFIILPFSGYLNDKTNNPKLISRFLLLGAGISGLIFSISNQVWLLFILNGFISSFISCVSPICERMASATKYRYGTIRVWGTIGYAAAAQIAGLTLQYIAPSFVFVLLFISTALTVIFFLGTDSPAPVKTIETPTTEKKKRDLSVLKNINFILFAVIAFIFFGTSGTSMAYIPVLLTKTMGLSETAMGTVISVSTLVEIPVIVFSHKFMDKYSSKTLLWAACLITLIQFVCYGLVSNTAVVVLTVIMFKAIGTTLFIMISLKIVRNVIGLAFTTTALSIINSVQSVGMILLQNLAGYTIDNSSIQTLFLILAGLILVAIALTAFLKVGNSEKVFSAESN